MRDSASATIRYPITRLRFLLSLKRLAEALHSKADGVRSTNERFREDIEKILDLIIPKYVDPDRLVELWASEVTDSFDWAALLERLCGPPPQGRREPKPVTYSPTLWD